MTDDYAYLTELLTTTGCPAAAVRLITANYRSETGPPEAEAEARADYPGAEFRRRGLRERRDKLEDLELARFEREMSGGGAPSAELDAVRRERDELRARLERLERKNDLEGALVPLVQRLDAVERRSSGREDPDTERRRITNDLSRDALTGSCRRGRRRTVAPGRARTSSANSPERWASS